MIRSAATLLLLFATLAGSVAARAEGPYAGAAFGLARTVVKDTGLSFSGNDVSSRWVLGYDHHFEFLPAKLTLGVEAGYQSFGHPTDYEGSRKVEFSTRGFPVEATAGYALGPAWRVFGRVGVLFWRLHATTADFVYSGSDSGTALTVGGGVSWTPTGAPVDVVLQADANAVKDGIQSFLLGVVWRFGPH
jgi:hypothetical protein